MAEERPKSWAGAPAPPQGTTPTCGSRGRAPLQTRRGKVSPKALRPLRRLKSAADFSCARGMKAEWRSGKLQQVHALVDVVEAAVHEHPVVPHHRRMVGPGGLGRSLQLGTFPTPNVRDCADAAHQGRTGKSWLRLQTAPLKISWSIIVHSNLIYGVGSNTNTQTQKHKA